jgi:hypothetical protein
MYNTPEAEQRPESYNMLNIEDIEGDEPGQQ